MTRLPSPLAAAPLGAATVGTGVGVPTSCPGDGGGGGTSGRADVACAGVETDGVGCDGYGVPVPADSEGEAGVRRIPGMLAGVTGDREGERTAVAERGVSAGLFSGVVAPTVIRRIAPQTLQRARTPFGGTFAGSTRKTDRQS